jgi:cytochrome c556
MEMKRIIIALMICATAATGAAIAQDGPIKQRQALMKKNGDATKLVNAMLKGEKPYDAAAAAEAIKGIGGAMDEFITLFPEGSTSADSSAKPEIWKNKADFEGWAKQVKDDTPKTVTAAAGGAATLQPAFAEFAKSCRGCHDDYRTEKKK